MRNRNFEIFVLDCGPILDNLEINPLVRTTVLYYTVDYIQILYKFLKNLDKMWMMLKKIFHPNVIQIF